MPTTPTSITELVEKFQRNLDEYKNPRYNETLIRVEFVNPFWKALGWDVDNTAGYAMSYRDVIHEDQLKVSGASRAPDYSFRIGGARKFFLETKKPAVNLKDDPGPAFQLRRYAYSAKLPLSILTDFEEFIVYDCRLKPALTDKPATGRIMYYTYRDYAAKWEEISRVFSKEAVLRGDFDRFSEGVGGKRGTEIDRDFLNDLDQWRIELARNIALRNPGLTGRELNYAVQLTIDRVIFLRMCEDRDIEQYELLLSLLNGTQIYRRLLEVYYRADERYNSGLFHFEAKDGPHPDNLTPRLEIDDKVLKEIISALYYPKCPYEFSVLPVEVLGNAYEQFLGKRITLTEGHRARIEEKPEVRKAGGVYYTPQYIVDYIVKNTVGKLCTGKTPDEISELRILDPACGSGSFLLGAYQFLLDWHVNWYREEVHSAESMAHSAESGAQRAEGREPGVAGRARGGKRKRQATQAIFQGKGGEWYLTTAEKKRILTNTIYGVDIDANAVEVTKLSLLLKVLEHETSETLNQQLGLWKERALPNLDSNIKCGNSLIGTDFYAGQQAGLFNEEESLRINAFDWEREFPEVFVKWGFDAVIGNPPWGAYLSNVEIDFLLNKYPLQQYNLDTYMLFIELGTKLIRKNGFWGMIIPNTWLLNLQTPRIRSFIFNKLTIVLIRHFKYYVFQNVTVDTEIIILNNSLPKSDDRIRIEILDKKKNIDSYEIMQTIWCSKNGAPVNIFEKAEYATITTKMNNTIELDAVCKITQGAKPFQIGKGKPPQTQKILEEKPFVSEVMKDKTFRPLLRGSLIQKWQILWNNNYWISFGNWLAEPRYSANYDAKEKIVIRQTGDSLVGTLDRYQFVVRDNLYTIVSNDDKLSILFVLGLINSKFLNWYYQNIINPEKGEALAQIKRGHLAKLPIAKIPESNPLDKSRHGQMVQLVERMLDLHQQLTAAQIPQTRTVLQRQLEATDRQIDQLVYLLYGLTAEEIRMVEGDE